MIKNGWDEKAAEQQPVAATQLFMHLFLSLLSFTFQFLCVVFYISSTEWRIKIHEFFLCASAKFLMCTWTSYSSSFSAFFYRNRADGSGIKKPALDITRIFECCLGKIFLRAAMDIAVVTHFATATVLRAFLRTTKLTFIWVFVKSILASSPFGGRVSLKMFSSLKSIFVNCCQRCEVIKI